jgi:hypothetical protein
MISASISPQLHPKTIISDSVSRTKSGESSQFPGTVTKLSTSLANMDMANLKYRDKIRQNLHVTKKPVVDILDVGTDQAIPSYGSGGANVRGRRGHTSPRMVMIQRRLQKDKRRRLLIAGFETTD